VTAAVDDLLERLRGIDTCAVSDALDTLGIRGVIAGLISLTAPTAVVGRVITVELGPADGTTATQHLCTAAIEHASPGAVLLVDHQGRTDCAGWGGNLSRAAQARGVEAAVVFGAARDVDESRSIGFSVFATAATPTTARGRAREVRWGEAITVDGVTAKRGDVLVADGSGVVVIPASQLEATVTAAERIAAKEQLIAQAIAEGVPAGRAMGRDYEAMLQEGP
jgi:4-hydroxy-4-methyl-2-oxoglutarate aldolase